MLGTALAEQRLQQRIGEHARTEGLLEAADRLFAAGVLQHRRWLAWSPGQSVEWRGIVTLHAP